MEAKETEARGKSILAVIECFVQRALILRLLPVGIGCPRDALGRSRAFDIVSLAAWSSVGPPWVPNFQKRLSPPP
jgi:hypothetical protein